MLKDRIIRDLVKGQSTLEPIALRLNEPADLVLEELKAMLIEGVILKSLISDFMPLYRLTEKTRQSLYEPR